MVGWVGAGADQKKPLGDLEKRKWRKGGWEACRAGGEEGAFLCLGTLPWGRGRSEHGGHQHSQWGTTCLSSTFSFKLLPLGFPALGLPG